MSTFQPDLNETMSEQHNSLPRSRSFDDGSPSQSSTDRRSAPASQRTISETAAILTEDWGEGTFSLPEIVRAHVDSVLEEAHGAGVDSIIVDVHEALGALRSDPLVNDALLELLVNEAAQAAQPTNDSPRDSGRELLDIGRCALFHHIKWRDDVAGLFHCLA
jgi:hypothetical protein